MEVRIGELLVKSGILTDEQVRTILDRQNDEGQPFGALSEELYGIDPMHVETAWARQYASLTRTIDPASEVFDPKVRLLITRRQAWQFRVLPIRFDGDELMMATTQQYLRRALGFAVNVVGAPTYLVLSEALPLGEALCRYYALPGLTPACVTDGGMDRLMSLVHARG